MKAVILAGGLGTRLSEETQIKPKPMVEIGEKPILWHIMKTYSAHGINDFVICLGYKGYMIKEYFSNYPLHTSSTVVVDVQTAMVGLQSTQCEPWKVTLVDTGNKTQTGGRIKRVREHIEDEDFCLTYGDGLSDVDITKLIEFHKEQSLLCTLTAVQPPGRFGSVVVEKNLVTDFSEKPEGDGGWIDGGFFVASPKVIEYIEDDSTNWETTPLERITEENQLSAFLHRGFWRPMDTLRDKHYLESLWESGEAPWKVW